MEHQIFIDCISGSVFRKGLVGLILENTNPKISIEFSTKFNFQEIDKGSNEIIVICLHTKNQKILLDLINKEEEFLNRVVLVYPKFHAYLLKVVFNAGVKGILESNCLETEFKECFVNILSGTPYIFMKGRNTIINTIIFNRNDSLPSAKELAFSSREISVLELITNGYTTKEISQELGISSRTVDSYKKDLKSKTGSKNIIELVHKVFKQKLI